MENGKLQKTRVSVFYYSKSGNTKKIADAIAEEMGVSAVQAGDVGKGYDMKKCDLLFVGSGNYAKKAGKEMISFLETLLPADGKTAAVFGTAGGSGKEQLEEMKKILQRKGIKVLGDWTCLGQEYSLKNMGHPDEEDCVSARKFSKRILKKIEII